MPPAIEIHNLSHTYGDRTALDGIGLRVNDGEIYGVLGPNGGGKTTLFGILSTHLRLQAGSVRMFGEDISDKLHVRSRCGVVFQRPSLDPKLKVSENLKHHGWLYGLSGTPLQARIDVLLDRFDLQPRAGDLIETLSGGLQRRVELAKATIHEPDLLIFDEPSTGLDPGARLSFWNDLERLRSEAGTTVVVTTHFLEEAERCDRIGLLSEGRWVAEGPPADLKREVGEEIVHIVGQDPKALQADLLTDLSLKSEVVDGMVRLSAPGSARAVSDIYARYADRIDSVTVGRPSLEDVFIAKTGQAFEVGDGQ